MKLYYNTIDKIKDQKEKFSKPGNELKKAQKSDCLKISKT